MKGGMRVGYDQSQFKAIGDRRGTVVALMSRTECAKK